MKLGPSPRGGTAHGGTPGTHGVAERFMAALASVGVNVILTSQARGDTVPGSGRRLRHVVEDVGIWGFLMVSS